MKLRIAVIFLFFLLLLPACENGVIISYNPDELSSTKFIKSEKLKSGTDELNCDYSDPSHQHNDGDSYYIYFTLKSGQDSPINPENELFVELAKTLDIEFQKQETENNFVEDNDIHTEGPIEFVSLGKDLTKRQNFNFLIDLMSKEPCIEGSDINTCSLSFGLEQSVFNNFLGKILAYLSSEKIIFDKKHSDFIEDDFIGVNYMAFSAETDDDIWLAELTKIYLDNMDKCSGSLNSNKDKVLCWLELNDEGTYKDLRENAKFHRKLWDAYIKAANIVKDDSSKNKNIILLTSGYEEGYYDVDGLLDPKNQSISTEEQFFDAIKASDNIPVFIAPQTARAELSSFPENGGVAPDGTDIDNKFYKLACLTNGAYFPEVPNKQLEWRPVGINDYNSTNGVIGKMKSASYGMWRVKVKFKNTANTDRAYTGAFKIISNTGSKKLETSLVGYKVIR